MRAAFAQGDGRTWMRLFVMSPPIARHPHRRCTSRKPGTRPELARPHRLSEDTLAYCRRIRFIFVEYDLLPCHRQPTDTGNGLDRAIRPYPIGHDDGEHQQTDRDREWQRPAAGAVE